MEPEYLATHRKTLTLTDSGNEDSQKLLLFAVTQALVHEVTQNNTWPNRNSPQNLSNQRCRLFVLALKIQLSELPDLTNKLLRLDFPPMEIHLQGSVHEVNYTGLGHAYLIAFYALKKRLKFAN